MPTHFAALLFDLDGVLVDTEHLISHVWTDIFTSHGLHLPPAELTELTTGQTFEGVLAGLATRGWQPPEDFLPLLEHRFNEAFAAVPALAGAQATLEAVQQMGLPFAVVSNSSRTRLPLKLRGAGLADYFAERAFDPSCVGGRGKPLPDLYLYAAQQLGVAPQQALVIEDSLPGVRAGVAAGATVWGLLAGSHVGTGDEEKLRHAGAARVLHSHAEMREALGLQRLG